MMFLRQETPCEVDAAAGDVRVNVDAAGHHDHSARVDLLCGGGDGVDDRAGVDTDVANVTVDAIGRVVDAPTSDPQLRQSALLARFGRRASRVIPSLGSRSRDSRAISPRITSAGSRWPRIDGRSGNGTSSMRSAVPPT